MPRGPRAGWSRVGPGEASGVSGTRDSEAGQQPAADGGDGAAGEDVAGRDELVLDRGRAPLQGRLEGPHPFEGVKGVLGSRDVEDVCPAAAVRRRNLPVTRDAAAHAHHPPDRVRGMRDVATLLTFLYPPNLLTPGAPSRSHGSGDRVPRPHLDVRRVPPLRERESP